MNEKIVNRLKLLNPGSELKEIDGHWWVTHIPDNGIAVDAYGVIGNIRNSRLTGIVDLINTDSIIYSTLRGRLISVKTNIISNCDIISADTCEFICPEIHNSKIELHGNKNPDIGFTRIVNSKILLHNIKLDDFRTETLIHGGYDILMFIHNSTIETDNKELFNAFKDKFKTLDNGSRLEFIG